MMAVLSLDIWSADWQLDKPSPSVAVLRNDSGRFPGPVNGVLHISRGNIYARKVFDLNRLPEEVLKNPRRARIKIYTALYEYSTSKNPKLPSNGLSEYIFISVNGKKIILPTCDPRFPVKDSIRAPLKFRWVPVEFPVAWLKSSDGKLTVETGKIDSLTHDDYYYPGIDRSTANSSSWVSVNSGRTWTQNWGNIADNSELMIRLELDKTGGSQPDDHPGDFLSVPGSCPFKSRGKTTVKGGFLHFTGYPDSSLMIPGGEKIKITGNGLTMVCTVRFLDNPQNSPKQNRDMMLFFKSKSFFLGRTGNRFNFSFSSNGKSWNQALVGGEVPPNNQWIHLSAVAERINDTAQGETGTRLKIYVNGELRVQKMFRNFYPAGNDMPLLTGGGLPGYDLNADIAGIAVFNRVLSSTQIAAMAANTPLVDAAKPGSVKVSPQLEQKLKTSISTAKSAETRWFYQVLLRAAGSGFPETAISSLPEMANLASLEAVSRKLSEGKSGLILEITPYAALLMATGPGKVCFPVLGFLDRKIGLDVFAGRTVEWSLRYRDGKGRSGELNNYSTSLKYDVKRQSAGNYLAVWKNDSFTVRSRIVFRGKRLEMDFAGDNPKKNYTVTEVVFPRWHLAKLPGKDTLVYPHMSGILADDPTRAFSMGSVFPSSRVSMQFSGYYNEQTGRYFAMEDPDAAVKEYQVGGQGGTLNVAWKQAVAYDPRSSLGNPVCPGGKAVIELYTGRWFEAGAVYKRFLASQAKWWIRDIPRTSTPEWFRNNPLNLLISLDQQHVREALTLRKYYDLPFAVNLAYWYNLRNPDFPEYVMSGKNAPENVKKLQENGVRIKAYVNPRLWGYCPKTCDGWQTSAVIMNEDGTPFVERYKRDHSVICPGADLTSKWNLHAIPEVARMGFMGLYQDQLPCAFPRVCFSTLHGHKLVNDPSLWLKNGYWPMFEKLNRILKQINPELAQDGEEASDPYLRCLDGYMVWRWTDQNHVPLFQSVYAPRAQFTGRLFDLSPGGSYDSFFVKSAEQFVYGEQLGWYHINNLRYASPQRLYSKKLAHLRAGLAPRFNRSDMIAPPIFKKPGPKLNTVWAAYGTSHEVVTDKVLSSAWKVSGSDSFMLVFANTVKEKITISPVWTQKNADCVVFREQSPYKFTLKLKKGQSFQLTLNPYESAILVSCIEPEEDAAYKEMMAKVAGFRDYGPILYHPQNFRLCRQLSISDSVPLRPVDSSWRRNAFMPRWQCLAFDKARWIQSVDGGEIFYGVADFGSRNWKNVSIDLAAEDWEAGTMVRLYADRKLLAEWRVPDTGKWIRFKPVSSELKFIPSGKMKLVLKISGKGCRIKNIRFAAAQPQAGP